MDHPSSWVSNSPSPPCGAELPGMFPVILWACALADSQLLNQHVTTAGRRWESCLPYCLCFATLLVGTRTLRFPSSVSKESVETSVTPAPWLALCLLSLRGAVEWVLDDIVSGTSSQRLAFSSIGVIVYICRNRRKVFNLPRLHLLAETCPLTTEAMLHYQEVPSLDSHIRKRVFSEKVGKPQWMFYTVCGQISVLRHSYTCFNNVLQRVISCNFQIQASYTKL